MADRQLSSSGLNTCDCIDGHPADAGAPCKGVPRYLLRSEDGDAYLCSRHAKVLREMAEPGTTITKLEDLT